MNSEKMPRKSFIEALCAMMKELDALSPFDRITAVRMLEKYAEIDKIKFALKSLSDVSDMPDLSDMLD